MFDTTSPNVRKQILGLLTNRSAIGCLTALACQQMVEASSTVWLVKMMACIASGQNFFPWLALYLASIAIYYIPNCIAFILKTTWKQQAQRSFVNAFVSSNKNNIGEWSNHGIKENKLSMLTSEGPTAINALIDYVWDLVAYVLSVLFNLMALSVVVEPLFALTYTLSMACVIVVMKVNRRAQRQLTQKALTARVELTQSLLASWDNVLLGNEYNFKLWENKTGQRLDKCLQRNLALERFDQFLAIFVSLITTIPSLLVVAFFMTVHRSDPVRLSEFIVILPLLFNILSYTYQMLALVFRWNMHRSKLTAIYKTIQTMRDSYLSLAKKVKWQKMSITAVRMEESTSAPSDHISLVGPQSVDSAGELMSYTSRSGRWTIRGENGCGKSTALVILKNTLNSKAFFLPTHNQLSFTAETNKYSTGESLKNRLIEILDQIDAEVLLLDEWDANLDAENKESLNTLIDQLALEKCVIEVRHR
jgi:ABC-type multidrug transport system fused ATPase/permease subunit